MEAAEYKREYLANVKTIFPQEYHTEPVLGNFLLMSGGSYILLSDGSKIILS